MWYHAITEFGESKRYWWNRSHDALVSELLVPMLSKHCVLTPRRGKHSLFNFGAISYATIVKTEAKLKRKEEGKVPVELTDLSFVKEHNATKEFVNEVRLLQSSMPNRSLLQQAIAEPVNQVFVIMKFGDASLDSAYEGVIKPIGIEFGYDVLRVDEIQDSKPITSQILESIAKSKIVLVELSGERPNCYYEAGYAQAIGKEIIFCIRRGEPVHFDLAGYRFIEWETEASLRRKLRQRFESYIETKKTDE